MNALKFLKIGQKIKEIFLKEYKSQYDYKKSIENYKKLEKSNSILSNNFSDKKVNNFLNKFCMRKRF